jgi:translation initiation factor eIF-2B subunit beta
MATNNARALTHASPQVLVGAHAVLANGGVVAPSGSHVVALAARRHSVPLVVLVGLHKLSPLFPHDPDVTFNGGAPAYGFIRAFMRSAPFPGGEGTVVVDGWPAFEGGAPFEWPRRAEAAPQGSAES